ncbi:nucleoside-diphosphate kinase [candidate division WWE3 bacterium]|uniref:nucleoside-diphosphate kinase n=1 Tax=candidate division WWE3 bacterium TaxID=2053526 RepID=A0A7X9E7P6_UNCKA|nr:nucleoside-diphosphate kinase [candidate division WWE3 bacterium]
MMERTLLVIKPDAVKRGIVGEILQRVENMGFVIKAAKLVQVDEKLGEAHYPNSEEWKRNVGVRTIEDCEKYGMDLMENMGTTDPIEIGNLVKKWNVDYLCSGPVFAFVLEGLNAVERLRSLVGHTVPTKAAPGTIRGDYSLDSAILANMNKRCILNLVHASGTVEEAKDEINLWFKKEEILN